MSGAVHREPGLGLKSLVVFLTGGRLNAEAEVTSEKVFGIAELSPCAVPCGREHGGAPVRVDA